MTILDLKAFREEKLKIKTQENFAKLLGVDQYVVSRWEKKPETLRLDDILTILSKTGITFEELLGQKKILPNPLQVKTIQTDTATTCQQLFELITTQTNETSSLIKFFNTEINSLKKQIYLSFAKPLIAVSGKYGTGKTTLVNRLLGIDKLPTTVIATTSIPTYIMHISDRPDFIADEQAEVWIFRDNLNTSERFDIKRLYDYEYCRKWKLAACGIESISSYGSYSSEDSRKENAGAAIAFLDIELLRNINFVDLPGYGGSTTILDQKSFEITREADILIHMSDTDYFMQENDIALLRQYLTSPLPLNESAFNKNRMQKKIFILASKADKVSCQGQEELNRRFEEGKTALLDSFSLEGLNCTALDNSFYLYSAFDSFLNLSFIEALKKSIETIPISSYEAGNTNLKTYLTYKKQVLEAKIEELEAKKETGTLKQHIKQKELEDLLELCTQEIHSVSKSVREEFYIWLYDYLAENNIKRKLDSFSDRVPVRYISNKSIKQKCIQSCCNSMEFDIKKEFLDTIKRGKKILTDGKLAIVPQDTDLASEKLLPILRRIETITPPTLYINSRANNIADKLGNIFFSDSEKSKIAKKIAQTYRQSNYFNEYIQIATDYWEAFYQHCYHTIQELEEKEASTENTPDNLEQELDTLKKHLLPLYDNCLQIMIWDNGKKNTRPCSAARCAGYFPTDEEISQEVKDWIKNNPEKNAELVKELDRFNGINRQ